MNENVEKTIMVLEQSLEDLAASATEGDMDALEALLQRIHGYLKSQLFLFGITESVIDDVAQDAVMRMYQSLIKYEQDKPFLPWFRAIIRYAALDHQRRYAREARNLGVFREYVVTLFTPHTPAATEALLSMPSEHLHGCLNQLPQQHRKLVSLRYEDEMNSTEIAETLDMKPSAVRQMLTRIRLSLRQCLEQKRNFCASPEVTS